MSEIVKFDAFRHLGIETWTLVRRARYDPATVPRLYRILRSFKPEIVHSWNSMCTVIGAPLAKMMGARFVDGSVRAAPPGLSLRNPDYFRSRLTLPLVAKVIANSSAGLAVYRIPADRGVCIRNGFDFARASPGEPGEIKRQLGVVTKYVVGMIASFSEKKDYATFLEMARRVTAVRDDVTFLAVGTGKKLSSFQTAFPAKSFPRISFLGSRSDVEEIASIFTVGVLTTNADVHGEGIPNALMECMALGKPVVATDCGGTRELVDGQSGILVGSRDVGALTYHVLRLLDRPELAEAFGSAGRRKIREEFSLQRMTREHLDLYTDLLQAS
jgi:glycosyltransferase involved in cell wall biosynthesis